MKTYEAPFYRDIKSVFGEAVADGTNQVVFTPPFPMRIAWNINHTVGDFLCHKDIAESLYNILVDIKYHYGLEEIKRLGIDIFGGCYDYRKQAEGNRFSTHSWGLALDLNPQQNKIKDTSDVALFAKPEYKPMIDIFYNYGWFSEGVELNKNWRHFQAVRYK